MLASDAAVAIADPENEAALRSETLARLKERIARTRLSLEKAHRRIVDALGIAVAYFMLGLSIWMAPVDLSTKCFWAIGVFLLTLSLVNFVKYRMEEAAGEFEREYAVIIEETQPTGGSASGTTDNVCFRHLSAKQEREWRTPSIL